MGLSHRSCFGFFSIDLFRSVFVCCNAFTLFYLQAYCTDGEKALRGALGQEFDRSVMFVCKIHKKHNIKDKCSKLQISYAVSKVIGDDIFNSEGLVHASTETEYWKKL